MLAVVTHVLLLLVGQQIMQIVCGDLVSKGTSYLVYHFGVGIARGLFFELGHQQAVAR